jgi:hypothetical protein
MNLWEMIEIARYNRRLYQTGKANRDEIHLTTVGWRPDPINKEDGYTKDPCPPSHNPNGEYYRIVRKKGTRE